MINNERPPEIHTQSDQGMYPRLERAGDSVPLVDESHKLIDVSGAVTPADFALIQQAGQKTGLQIDQVTQILSASDTTIPIMEGHIGVRYMTADHELFDAFQKELKDLRDAAQITQSAQG